jgi:probable DNA repair protein
MPSYLNHVLGKLEEGTVVVTATRRLARYFLHQFDHHQRQKGVAAWRTPKSMSWSEWIESEWGLLAVSDPGLGQVTLLDDEQELALWEKVIAKANARSRDRVLLQVTAAARAARDTRRTLLDWRIPRGEIEPPVNEDTGEFLKWLTEFDRTMDTRRWLCASELPVLLEIRLDKQNWRPAGPFVFAGFDQWVPSRKNLLAKMKAAGVEVEIQAGPKINQNTRAVSCLDRRREFEAAAHWVVELLEGGAEGPIGVVVDDLAADRDRVDSVFDQVLHQGESMAQNGDRKKSFHLSAGKSLSEYPAVSTALVLLDFLAGARPVRDLTRLLHSPYIAGGMVQYSDYSLLDIEMRRRGRQDVTLSDLWHCVEQLGMQSSGLGLSLARIVGTSAPETQAPPEWAASFLKWLESFDWPGDRPLSSEEYQTVEAWRELLSRFARLNLIAPRMDAATAVGTVRRMAGRRIFQSRESPAPVQILGVAESSGMQFSHLWISGMTDEAWPPPADPDPFIPFVVQRRFGLPGSGMEADLARYSQLSARLLAAAANAVISYPLTDSDQPQRLSGLFQSSGEPTSCPGGITLLERIRESSPGIESILDPRGPPLDHATLRGGASVFRDQSACPFRAFARHRLAVVDTPRLEPGLDASVRGNLVHDCLARVWREIGSSRRLQEINGKEFSEILDRAVRAALHGLKNIAGSPFMDRVLELERARLTELVRAWLDIERERTPFDVVMVERKITASYFGLDMSLRVDRIDELEDGTWVIIDYKTGTSVNRGQWQGERPEDPQLPLYLLALERGDHDIAGLAFAHLRVGGNRFVGVVRETPFADGIVALDDWEENRENWETALNALADQFKQGDATVDPRKSSVCDYCQIGPLCRVFDRHAVYTEVSGP